MNIILFTKGGRPFQLNLAHAPTLALTAFLTLALLSGIAYSGYFLATRFGAADPGYQLAHMRANLNHQKAELAELHRAAEEDVNALAVRMGQLQSHIIRLDALGERLTKMAGLDKGEFDFANPPAQGGPEVSAEDMDGLPPINFMSGLDGLATQIQERETQLSVLENLLMNRNLQKQVRPAGRPILSGWMSSPFGVRTDPFTGRQARHHGVDFAGVMGSDIIAVASGVVTWAGQRYGYGNLVEINHGNGYVTRYAHNKAIVVQVGDTVKKGQVVSKMGSSGRSTGPHVHFEVLQNGRVVNPITYIQSAD